MKITAKIVLSFLCISLIPLTFSIFLSYSSQKQALTQRTLNQLISVASIQRSRLNAIVSQNIERLRLVSSRTQLRLSLQSFTTDGDGASQTKMNKILKDALSSIEDFHSISVHSLDGTIVASTKAEVIGTNEIKQDYFLRGMKEDSADNFFLDERGHPAVRLSGPLYLNKELLGVIVIHSDLQTMISSVSDYSGLGDTGETLVAAPDRQGALMLLLPSRFAPEGAMRQPLSGSMQAASVPAGPRETLHQLMIDVNDYRHKKVLAASQQLESTGWLVIVKKDADEALEGVRRMRNILTLILLISILIILPASLILARGITRPIIMLTDAAEEIATGNYTLATQSEARDETGVLARAFNTMATNLITANAQLDQKNQELQKKNRELEQIIYVASHDLRSPLVNVQGFSRELAENIRDLKKIMEEATSCETLTRSLEPILEEEIPLALRFINAGIKKMDALLSGILKISRLGRAALNIRPLKMNEVIGEVVDALEFQSKEKEVTVEVGDLPDCQGDETQISQVFSNLVGNAIKFTDPERTGTVKIRGHQDGERVIYSVEDNGIGIDQGHLRKIFEIFHQLNPHSGEGQGLGLTIVRTILDQHSGEIEAQSTPGQGSQFMVTLPAPHKITP